MGASLNTWQTPSQAEFSESRSWDSLGCQVFIRDEHLWREGTQSREKEVKLQCQDQPGRRLEVLAACWGVLHQLGMAAFLPHLAQSPNTSSPGEDMTLGKAALCSRDRLELPRAGVCLLAILPASGQQVLPWRGFWWHTSMSTQIVIHSTHMTTLQGRSFNKSPFTDEKTEAWRN